MLSDFRSFIIAGIPGIVIGFIILLTVREPNRSNIKIVDPSKREDSSNEENALTVKEKFKQLFKLMRWSLILLCFASSIRNAGKLHLSNIHKIPSC